ncbi:hypothetical protein [Granulicatella adiacens]|uniref:hypothetical protein n=1 Tax=Granulicatella adiacens TaxID=46124 RepID=UPI003C723ACC
MERMITKQVIKENPELAKGFGCLSFLAFVFFSYSYCFLQQIRTSNSNHLIRINFCDSMDF